jgi:hypothetical protein
MGNKLYVGNLPYSVRDSDLEQAFGQFGAVTSAKVMMERDTGRSKGFGFVEMGSDAEAQAAINGMNGQPLGGRSVVVNEARPMEARPPALAASAVATVVAVAAATAAAAVVVVTAAVAAATAAAAVAVAKAAVAATAAVAAMAAGGGVATGASAAPTAPARATAVATAVAARWWLRRRLRSSPGATEHRAKQKAPSGAFLSAWAARRKALVASPK